MTEDKNTNAIINSLKNIEYYPAILDNDIQLAEYERLPLTNLLTFGAASEAVTNAIQKVFTTGGGSGLYWVNVANSGHLAETSLGYIGSTLSNSTNQVMSQARMLPLAVNPMQMFMTLALAGITRKIDESTQIGQNILSYLELQDEAKLIGNINFLTDTINSYKHNWDNPRYIDSNLGVVQNIKREAEQSIVFQNKHINSLIRDSKKLHHDRNVFSRFNTLFKDGRRYQLSLYIYSFASFLGVMLEESFNHENIQRMLGKINDYALGYREIYTECYNHLESYAQSSIQEYAVKGLSTASKTTGSLLSHISIAKKIGLDKTLTATSKRISSSKSTKTDDMLNKFVPLSDTYTRQFTDCLHTVDKLFNGSAKVLFDKDNLYLKTA